MRYRQLGKTGLSVSVIGLGMEHVANPPKRLASVVGRAVDAGVNYLDMVVWMPDGKDELGAALAGCRGQVILAGHLGIAETDGQYRKTRDVKECEELWNDWLWRLRTDCIDILHLHFVDEPEEYEQVTGPGGLLELALRLKREGKARFLGLTGHRPSTAIRAIESGAFDVVMHDVNILSDADDEKRRVAHACASHGVGLVTMKTFAGGEALRGERPVSPVRCINYCLSQPGVSTALVGARSVAELESDLTFLEATDDEKDFASILGDLHPGVRGTCTYCGHCQPCPCAIDIGATIRLLASAQYGLVERLRADYAVLPAAASDCIECEDCMERCPFGVDVVSKMREASCVFEA